MRWLHYPRLGLEYLSAQRPPKQWPIITTIDVERVASTLEALIQGAIFQFGFMDGRGIEAHLRGHVQTFLEPYLLANAA